MLGTSGSLIWNAAVIPGAFGLETTIRAPKVDVRSLETLGAAPGRGLGHGLAWLQRREVPGKDALSGLDCQMMPPFAVTVKSVGSTVTETGLTVVFVSVNVIAMGSPA